MCPACIAKRIHTPEELALHHPLAGHGCYDGRWTSKEAEQAHIEEVRKWKGEATHA